MCTYKGNAGNLMQHWTLCEVLTVAQRHASCLSYVDAHAMAPMASVQSEPKDERRETFDRVRDGRRSGSVYESAWHRLAADGEGYPNSAAFVQNIWKGRVSMLLCERDPSTAAKIKAWAQGRGEVEEGDWRKRFAQGLPDAPMTLISFDPYMYNRRRDVRDPCPGNLYPCDLELTVRALAAVRGGVLVQLSTYDTQDGNSQDRVLSSADAVLETGRLHRATDVRVRGKMMSLVYVRGIDWFAELADMPRRFGEWLDTHK